MADEKLVEEEPQTLPESIKYTFVETPGYKIAYINDVYGGLTPKRELQIDFLREYLPRPKEEIFEVTAEGKKGKRIFPPDEMSEQIELIREKEFSVIITIDFAKSLYEWLGKKLKDYAESETTKREANEQNNAI